MQIYILVKNNPKNFHDNFLKIKLSWDGTGRNLLLACESSVVGVVFLIGSKAWMVKGQHPHPPAETAVHLLLLVMCLSNCCSAVKKNLEFCRSHTYLITCLYEWKRFWHLKSVLFLVSKICLLYGELLPFLGMLTISNVSRSTWCWAQLSSGQDLGSGEAGEDGEAAEVFSSRLVNGCVSRRTDHNEAWNCRYDFQGTLIGLEGLY